MNLSSSILEKPAQTLSDAGRARLLSRRGEPPFLAGWERVLFIHFEVDAVQLQRDVPFPIDLRDGKAYVSLVAFTMLDMRFRIGGKALSWMLKPVSTHEFLNVRTYVRHGDEGGIYFLTEWLSNWLSVRLGPLLYGLPYHYAKINYKHAHEKGRLSGKVETHNRRCNFNYDARLAPDTTFAPCENDSPDKFLLERYTAFTSHGSTRRFFRIWHPPWPQIRVKVSISDDSLLKKTWPWFSGARLSGANYSPGFDEVWMGRAHHIR
ncbi:MAG: DUF2071 domain-containing protein [Verrucomicrobiales bacterium]|nr:DUF2071 domain-containing protein [Verrucomicrobiales bacterium]